MTFGALPDQNESQSTPLPGSWLVGARGACGDGAAGVEPPEPGPAGDEPGAAGAGGDAPGAGAGVGGARAAGGWRAMISAGVLTSRDTATLPADRCSPMTW